MCEKAAPTGFHWETEEDGFLYGCRVLVPDVMGPKHPRGDRCATPGHHWELVEDGSLRGYYVERPD